MVKYYVVISNNAIKVYLLNMEDTLNIFCEKQVIKYIYSVISLKNKYM
jgi:hypothetical protein